jgi:Transcriptional regulator
MLSGMSTDRPDSLGAAARALVDAAAALNKALGQTSKDLVTDQVADTLHQAAAGLSQASESVARKSAGTRRKGAESTRAELLVAAARVFSERGYEGASVEDVATAAGYTKGAVYSNFGSKEKLLLALARQQFNAACDVEKVPQGHLTDTYRSEIQASINDPSRLIGLEILAYGVRHAHARPEMAVSATTAFEKLAEVIHHERGSDGAPTQDDRDTALALSSIASFAALYGTLGVGKPDVTDSAMRIIDKLLARDDD